MYDIVEDCQDVPCLLPDWLVISVDDCLGWLQDLVYQGFAVGAKKESVGHASSTA